MDGDNGAIAATRRIAENAAFSKVTYTTSPEK
jgi:hypothetical protein